MTISNNKVVSLIYELRDGSSTGEIVETVNETNPLTFLYGSGNMLPKFEEYLKDLKAGDDFTFTLAPAEAYGEVFDDAVIELPIDVFKVDGKIDPEMLQVGNMLPMQDNEGNPLDGLITEIGDERVTMDFNHPMAGRSLHFTGKIQEVREATPEEISHGHVHGPHGHHH